MKKLFKEDETYSWEALEIGNEVREILSPVIEKYANKGYSIRDLEYVAKAEIELLCLSRILKRSR